MFLRTEVNIVVAWPCNPVCWRFMFGWHWSCSLWEIILSRSNSIVYTATVEYEKSNRYIYLIHILTYSRTSIYLLHKKNVMNEQTHKHTGFVILQRQARNTCIIFKKKKKLQMGINGNTANIDDCINKLTFTEHPLKFLWALCSNFSHFATVL